MPRTDRCNYSVFRHNFAALDVLPIKPYYVEKLYYDSRRFARRWILPNAALLTTNIRRRCRGNSASHECARAIGAHRE
ncbi:MAG: hypothetical protein JO028_05825 [Acidobacteriaceae bacterium]|nr:hypothetical protein [Acidobacteriaceae bacterium]